MHMGNVLCVESVRTRMATRDTSGRPAVGLRHPTVVPTNFEPGDDSDGDDETA